MKKASAKALTFDGRELEGGIEWIVARELAPLQDEIARLRVHVDALREAVQPW
jgi:hypothetical protein